MRILSFPSKKATVADATIRSASAPAGYGWENAIQNIYAERDRVELDLVGGIMADPLAGLAMAERAGADHSIIADDGLWIIYATATICRDAGRLTGQRFDDGMTVATVAKAGLIAEGLWDDADHRTFVHGTIFGPEALAALLHSWPSAAMVPHFAHRLIELNQRIDQAREHLRIARALIDGHSLGVLATEPRNSNGKTIVPSVSAVFHEREMEVAA